MAKTVQLVPISLRVSNEIKDLFEDTFQLSGHTSKNEFLRELLYRFDNSEDPVNPEVQIKEVEKERELKENEILLALSPVQLFILRETMFSSPENFKIWNEHISRMKAGNAPFLYFGNLYDPELAQIWNDYNESNPETDPQILKQNIVAELLNSYMIRIIEGEVENTPVNVKSIKGFLKDQSESSESDSLT